MTKIKTKKKPSKMAFFRYLSFALFIINIIFLGLIWFINVLPAQYFAVCVILFLIIDVFLIYLLLGKGWKKRMIGTFLSLIYIVGTVIGIVYELNTIGFLKKIGSKDYKTQNYSVIVLNNSKYESIDDIKKEKVGILDTKTIEGLTDAVAQFNKKINVSYDEFDDLKVLTDSLISKKNNVVLLEDTYLEIAKEDDHDFASSIKVIYTFSIDIATKDITKNVDITKQPFNIFIAGIDTYGNISSVARNDVNMLVTVNPSTHKIILTSIPRDYYVYLHGITTYKDKITHAGIHGIETTTATVEDLLDCDVNYYFKVNFTSLIDIVNSIGGIEIDSKYSFTTYDYKYSFKKGKIKLNGEQALAYARERKAFAGGDRTRGENQQLILTAIINKVMTKSLITKYNSLLNSVEDSFVTNLDNNNITKFIKKQIKDGSNWEIESIALNGTDAFDYTYAYKSAKSYVMQPDEESINEAKQKINSILIEN